MRLRTLAEEKQIAQHSNPIEAMKTSCRTSRYSFFGGDELGENIAGLYALVQSCEVNGIDPQSYLADVLVRVKRDLQARIDELLQHLWRSILPNTS